MMLLIIYFLTFNRTNIFAKEIENMTEQYKISNSADVSLGKILK